MRSGGQRVQCRLIAIGQHLGVAGDPQHGCQFPKFAEDPGIVGETELVLGGLQQAADLPGGHPHLVYGIVSVGPDGTVALEQPRHLGGHRLVHRVGGRLGALRGGLAEHLGQFGDVVRSTRTDPSCAG